MKIQLIRDGSAIGAVIGRKLQEGVSGWGDTVPEALLHFAGAIERERWNSRTGTARWAGSGEVGIAAQGSRQRVILAEYKRLAMTV